MALAIGGQTQQVLANLGALGPRKLGALGLIGVLVVALVGLGSYYLSRPDMETLYSGLDRTDVTRIGAALTEAAIPFDVNMTGDAILTPFSQTAPARMLLAEKGLPRSENAGYELFDNLGSIGLTSFMQEITRVRALEGEIARTIQTLKNVRAARVHIVLPDEGSFRREQRKPSASVVIRTESPEDFGSAQAVRSLVAAAIPGMNPNEVTVLNSDGTLLATADDSVSAAPTKLFGIEKIVSNSVEESIRRTLAPYLGIGNFQTSVITRLNTDRRQVSERLFDPDVRVERSTRTVRESGSSQNTEGETPVGVEQDIRAVDEAPAVGGGETSRDENERREELTNYEINEKTISTTSDGYAVERLSIAVVVNRQRLKDAIGTDATDAQVEERIAEIQALVASASGFSEARGDQIKVTAVDFMADGSELEPMPGPSLGEMFVRQSGTLINALTILVVAVLVIWFGLRPAVRAIAGTASVPEEQIEAEPLMDLDLALPTFDGSDVDLGTGVAQGSADIGRSAGMDPAYLEDLSLSQVKSPEARLAKLIAFDEAQAAAILRQWIHQKEAA
ncbi:MAG: flagellar basal-body MS-ring/collar protein FliF [Aurantimonas endophytica]|uniref:Flagellar M-ring protein n=1 Tax=Aurantimonas endophytica TaxID=1522175 RepID=A0A7W6HC85_9HYPH|nr:flagellar basal-body MS-ring/collar protein FliF [Aurantimonas endophytica]MBB4002496.1 flagellar M-ring protein FliF [Aurantimonas endophytica]MCO6401883.1 flagellar M-ring protein FliF [Aurantimonas endophytica]